MYNVIDLINAQQKQKPKKRFTETVDYLAYRALSLETAVLGLYEDFGDTLNAWRDETLAVCWGE